MVKKYAKPGCKNAVTYRKNGAAGKKQNKHTLAYGLYKKHTNIKRLALPNECGANGQLW